MYRVPLNRRAYAVNGYNKDLNFDNSVIIYNNCLRTNGISNARMFATKLYNIDRAIDVNVRVQKTPLLFTCEESQKLSLTNLFKEIDGNSPFIFGYNGLSNNEIKALKIDAPFISEALYQLKTQVWNEALTHIGISNVNVQKKERLITDEVIRNQGGTIASRHSRLNARREACKQINQMFNLDVWCDYREDYQNVTEAIDIVEGAQNSDGIGGAFDE